MAYTRTIRCYVLACATIFSAVLTRQTSAQFGEAAGIAEAMQPDYFKRDVLIISQGLALDEAQRAIVNTMYEDYHSLFEEGLERMKGRFEEMKDDLQAGDQQRIMRMIFAPFRDWAVEKGQLGEQFLANIEVVLTEEQLAQWPSVQRRLFRERMLHKGRLSGENLNLINIIRDMHLDQRTTLQIQPIIEAYEIALDQALHNREDPLIGRDNPMMQSLEEQDLVKQQTALRQHLNRQIAVRNVNDEYIEQIAMALPAEQAQQFRASALDRAYPRIYREIPAQRIFKVARELEGIDATMRESVISLEIEFLSELSVLNQKMLITLRKHEPEELMERASDFSRRMAGEQIEPKPNPMQPMFAQREELSRTYVRRLHGLLPEEQFGLLPGGYRWIESPSPDSPTGVDVQKDGIKQPPTKGKPR